MWRPIAVEIVLTILFSIFAIGCAVAVYFTVSIDPADDSSLCVVVNEAATESTGKDHQIHCYLCDKDVHNSSKHCRFCDKCVMRFDHHCKWLNTCVGKKNYAYFLAIVTLVGLLTSESLAISIALVVDSFAYPGAFMHRLTHLNHLKSRIGIALSLASLRGLLLASVVVLLGLVVMIYQLAAFHLVLVSRGITTYDYIVLENKRLRDRENDKLQAKVEKQQKARNRTTIGAAAAAAESKNSSRTGAGGGSGGADGAGAEGGSNNISDSEPEHKSHSLQSAESGIGAAGVGVGGIEMGLVSSGYAHIRGGEDNAGDVYQNDQQLELADEYSDV